MKRDPKADLYDRIKVFQQNTLSKKPTLEEIVRDVRMMNFRIRPVHGNVSLFDFSNREFLDSLWSLGKLDEFFRTEYPKIPEKERDVFFKLVDDMRVSLQQRINTTYSEKSDEGEKSFFEVEIYKDGLTHVN